VRIYRVDEPVDDRARRPEPSATRRAAENAACWSKTESVRELICESGWRGTATRFVGQRPEAAGRQPATIPSTLIADVIMPQMGGRHWPSGFSATAAHEVIFVSGYADEAIGDPRVLSAGRRSCRSRSRSTSSCGGCAKSSTQ
jgi:hypothetical protein